MGTPEVAFPGSPRVRDDARMQVITAGRGTPRTSLIPIVGHTVVATILVAVGLTMAYAAFATPLLTRLIPSGRPDTLQTVGGMILWAAALVAPAGYRLPELTTVRVPDGVDEAAVRKELLERHGIEIGGGLGPFAGTVWRIGCMGHTARMRNVTLVLAALRELLG